MQHQAFQPYFVNGIFSWIFFTVHWKLQFGDVDFIAGKEFACQISTVNS